MITAEKIRKIASIICKDEDVDMELESKHPYWSACSIYDEEDGEEIDKCEKFAFEKLLRNIDRDIKSSATEGHRSLRFQIDYDIDNSIFYKKIIFYVYIVLLNSGYDIDVGKEFVPECKSDKPIEDEDDCFDMEEYCQSRRIINLLIKW